MKQPLPHPRGILSANLSGHQFWGVPVPWILWLVFCQLHYDTDISVFHDY